METKMSVFMSVVIIFMPLLLFADNTSLYLILSFIILFVMSLENILLYFKSPDTNDGGDDLKSDLEGSMPLNLHKLELGFKTAKSIFIATFVVSVLFILNKNIYIIILSVFILFMSVVELRNFDSKHKRSISAAAGAVNILYLFSVAMTKYLL
jgi:hypothetical protein